MELIGRERVMSRERLSESVERAGADIAEHYADRAKRELPKTVLVMRLNATRGGRLLRKAMTVCYDIHSATDLDPYRHTRQRTARGLAWPLPHCNSVADSPSSDQGRVHPEKIAS